jgi:hypothetical protein
MEGLALFVWLAVAVGTFAGSAGEHRGSTPEGGFPAVPVPAGNSLGEARANLGKQLLLDTQLAGTLGPSCADCLGRP